MHQNMLITTCWREPDQVWDEEDRTGNHSVQLTKTPMKLLLKMYLKRQSTMTWLLQPQAHQHPGICNVCQPIANVPHNATLLGTIFACLAFCHHSLQLKESDIRPREIPSPEDSVFLVNMRSHQKVFHRLAEFGKMLREPGANFPEGVWHCLMCSRSSDSTTTQSFNLSFSCRKWIDLNCLICSN